MQPPVPTSAPLRWLEIYLALLAAKDQRRASLDPNETP
jgi:hypothetical protein